ncbi:FAD dependent oxidoreductase-domain-containing protein [Crucibulum laeve]|uniref:FAD dependent oxidoreductase-domain-containing protein n=1 Tax=Crucibulum laeve TaxID=68775 RepID=A0A5C3M089_9AGAR|nr:FAD dependent oxidoreductase-domain-containing protein [Crucibulum laeve]
MGAVFSHVPRTLRNATIRTIIHALRLVSPSVNALFERLDQDPGLPVTDPSTPYWLTPLSPISKHGSAAQSLPEYADIVIIGSGITGTSFARAVLDYDKENGSSEHPLQAVMLEARDVCSGATGRNGGHITPVLYQDYLLLKEKHGKAMAQKIIRFRLAHLPELLHVAEEEGLLVDSQCREVDAFDVFQDQGFYKEAKRKLQEYCAELPSESESYKIHEDAKIIKAFQLSEATVGCMSTRGGVIHPYRFITGILSRLLKSYPSNFHLFSYTPCTSISSSPDTSAQLYSVTTPKGVIKTPHVVHATNAWVSHLLPGMRNKVLPARGVMTAQVPRHGLGETPAAPNSADESNAATHHSWTSTRSFVLFPSNSIAEFDYLTQQATSSEGPSNYPPPKGELMFGGGFIKNNAFLTELGNVDDSDCNPKTKEYLYEALANYFTVEGNETGREEVKSTWSGILGISVDEKPWVGRIPEKVSGRVHPMGVSSCLEGKYTPAARGHRTLATPSEWMAAGYSGEGMVHAWMSGKALAYMVMGQEHCLHSGIPANQKEKTVAGQSSSVPIQQWFPEVYSVTEERWRDAVVEDLIASVLL